jgi:hypothetical protein
MNLVASDFSVTRADASTRVNEHDLHLDTLLGPAKGPRRE